MRACMADDIRAHPYRHEEKLALAEKQWQRKEASWAEAEARYQVYPDDVCDCSPVHGFQTRAVRVARGWG